MTGETSSENNRPAEIRAFMGRVFSGHDLLHIMDLEGIGVGATMLLVERIDTADHGRPLTFSADVSVAQVKEALRGAS